MAARIPTYMLAPNWDIPPNGPLTLGSILTDPKDPLRSLNRNTLIPVPQDVIITRRNPQWSATFEDVMSGKAGIWTTFLAPILGIGADVDVRGHGKTNETFRCDELETTYCLPSDGYILDTLKIPTVKAYTNKFWQRSVYMVTGLKVAKGASIETMKGSGFGAEGKLGLDGTPSGIPVGGGPKLKYERDKKTSVKFGKTDDFVMAYQLIRIKAKRDGGFKAAGANKWAILSDDKRRQELEETWDVAEFDTPIEGTTQILVESMDENGEVCKIITDLRR